MSRFFSTLLLIIIGGASLFAQNKYDLPQFGRESWSFIKQPTRWEGSDWLKLGLLGAGSFILIELADQPVRDLALEDRRYLHSVPIEAGRIWGELYTPVVLFAGFAGHSLLMNDKSTKKIAYELGQSCLYAGAITYILKSAFGRARPYMNEGTSSYHPFSFDDDDHSFPGGHATAAFALSTVLSRNAGPTWLKILAYVPAAITPISRIYEDKHWVSSCFFGGVVGYVVATWVVETHKKADAQVQSIDSTPLINVSFALD
jgi:membrane-associated phospholipid phosphatase